MSAFEKELLLEENPFLTLEMAKLFVEFSLDFLYLKDFDILFAVSTIEFPNQENPFIRFSGFNINGFRVSLSNANQMRTRLRKRVEQPFSEFKFYSDNWFYFKDKFALENINKKY